MMYAKFHFATVEWLRASLSKPLDVTAVFADSAELVTIFRPLRHFIITQGIKAGQQHRQIILITTHCTVQTSHHGNYLPTSLSYLWNQN